MKKGLQRCTLLMQCFKVSFETTASVPFMFSKASQATTSMQPTVSKAADHTACRQVLLGVRLFESLMPLMLLWNWGSCRVGEILHASLKDSPAEHLPVKQMVSALDPLVTPVLDPFVEGLTQPIYKVSAQPFLGC